MLLNIVHAYLPYCIVKKPTFSSKLLRVCTKDIRIALCSFAQKTFGWRAETTHVRSYVDTSHLKNFIEPMFSDLLWGLWVQMKGAGGSDGEEEEYEDIHVLLLGIIEGLTGIEPRLEFTLEECGLASMLLHPLS